MRLPERQRVALELREGEGLSYERIAERLGTGAGAVAQLLERARINLYDELRGTPLAQVAAPSAECERALPLIAARQDGELASSSEDASWLDSHLSGCDRCRLAAEQMGEAAAIYRGEAPASASTPGAADAHPTASAEQVAAAGLAPGAPSVAPGALAAPAPAPDERSRALRPSRRMALAGGLVGLALAGVAIALVANEGSPGAAPPAADAAARRSVGVAISDAHVVRVAHHGGKTARHARKRAKSGAGAADAATLQTGAGSAAAPLYTPTQSSGARSGGAPTSSHHASGGDTAVQPARQKSTATPTTKPKAPSSTQASQPVAQPASQPTPAPPPAEEATPPAEETTPEHGHKGEPPGKPTDRPPNK